MALDEVYCLIRQKVGQVLSRWVLRLWIGLKIEVFTSTNDRFVKAAFPRMEIPFSPMCHLPNMPVAYPAALSCLAMISRSSGKLVTLSTGLSGRLLQSKRSIPPTVYKPVLAPY